MIIGIYYCLGFCFADYLWVEGDVCEVAMELYNPLPFELKVFNMVRYILHDKGDYEDILYIFLIKGKYLENLKLIKLVNKEINVQHSSGKAWIPLQRVDKCKKI